MTVGTLSQAPAGLEIETITLNIYCLHAQIPDLYACECVCVCVVFAVLLLCIKVFSRVYQTKLTESSSKGRSLRTTSKSCLIYV